MMFIIALIIFIFGLGLNLSVGASDIGIIDSLKYLFVWDGSKEQLIISTLRLPRTLIGVFVGASLAVAGALMQAMTRNPLASPQIFGVNAGASLFVVASLVILPASPYSSVIFAFAGAAKRRRDCIYDCLIRRNDTCQAGAVRNGRALVPLLYDTGHHYFK